MARMMSPILRSDWAAGMSGAMYPIWVGSAGSLMGRPTFQTMTAKTTASMMLKRGPAKATMILSSGVMGGSEARGSWPAPSMASMGAICGRVTNPPAGIQPMPYWTPFHVRFQMGWPNQIWNLSTLSPRHRAARKCPHSWTRIMTLRIINARKMVQAVWSRGRIVDMSRDEVAQRARK